ncbi:MAG: hypothetical protein K8L97_14060 [Anaerolineae bacterium]|nr:hypothetical protein [Anaerolineae bacterium]
MKLLIFISFCILLVVPVSAQDQAGQLLFVGRVESDLEAEIFVLDLATNQVHNLTNSPGSDYAPDPSPDASQIVFVSERDDTDDLYFDYAIYVMDADGANVRLLVNNVPYKTTPVWSPDGAWIAYTTDEDESHGRAEAICVVYIIRPDGSDQRELATAGRCEEASLNWSPDSQSLVFVGDADIHTVSVETPIAINLTPDDGEDYAPEWSPDGTQIVFVSNRDDDYEIYVMNADGTEPFRLTNQPGSDFGPSWIPNGQRIVYVTDVEHAGNIMVVDVDGDNQRALTDDDVVKYSWRVSPDGSRIAFMGFEDADGGIDTLYLVSIEGDYLGQPINLEEVISFAELDWWSGW